MIPFINLREIDKKRLRNLKERAETYLFKNPWLSVHPLLGCHAQDQQA